MKSLFLLLFIFNFINFSENNALGKKIVKVWGQLESSSEINEGVIEDYDECVSKCLEDETCVMIAEISSGCVNFNVSNAPIVEKSDEDSGFKIGFKRTLDTCPPKTENAPLFGQTTITESFTSEGKTYNYDITELEMENSIKWKIVLICPEDSYPFTRGEIDVCVSIRFFPDSKICQNQTMGEKLCIESGDLGLTGPYSDEERDFFGEKLSTYESDFQNVNFWIDGKRDDASSPYTFSDSSISSTNGYGTIQDKAGNCYFLATRDGVQGVIYNHDCAIATDGKDEWCLRGAICRTF